MLILKMPKVRSLSTKSVHKKSQVNTYQAQAAHWPNSNKTTKQQLLSLIKPSTQI